MTTPIVTILSLLPNVRQRQPSQWSACCTGPNHAHGDKTASLSVRETPEGSVLLHCFAGCNVADVVAALGLEMHHLFPPTERTGREPKRIPRLLTAPQALELLDHDANVIAVAGGNIAHGVALSDHDLVDVSQAAGRINWLRSECMGGRHA
jgi:hypothetical protein